MPTDFVFKPFLSHFPAIFQMLYLVNMNAIASKLCMSLKLIGILQFIILPKKCKYFWINCLKDLKFKSYFIRHMQYEPKYMKIVLICNYNDFVFIGGDVNDFVIQK